MSRSSLASHIRLEGALFSRDFLTKLGAPLPELDHLTPQSYGLPAETKLREAIGASWNALFARWDRFKRERAKLPEGDYTVALTRREWLLPVLQELGFGRVQPTPALRVTVGDETKEYAISHVWNRTPLHLLGAGVKLDVKTAHVAGAAQMAPHALVQECLNRSGEFLWAVLSNGLQWRVLRDSAAIARRSYVEFDLEAIFESENTADFALFWLLCHASRFEWRVTDAGEAQPPLLEVWLQSAHTEGTRALDNLRKGVEKAIVSLATGFLRHPANTPLRERLRGGTLVPLDFYKLSLRVVYRMLFVLVAEAKDALLLPGDTQARERYERYYSLGHLRERAAETQGTSHSDAWQGARLTFRLLRAGEPGLALPALGGFLFDETLLDGAELANDALFEAMRDLCSFWDGAALRQVNFNLGSEELGSVYESLLELSPRLDLDGRRFELETLAGNERKTTGSYYTPEILVKSLLDTALEPVLDRAALKGEAAILDLKVCDPACGSGHFLTAAARRIAERLALLRTGGNEPSLPQRREALRDVVGRCIYGVDLNPMAVELCKVALWMEGLEPGRPLSFLDSHIRAGNSLLGATPAMVDAGLPDEAFTALEGDERALVSELKRDNRSERIQPRLGFEPYTELGNLRQSVQRIEGLPDETLAGVKDKESHWRDFEASEAYRQGHLLYDAWCAAFVVRKTEDTRDLCLTTQTLFNIRQNGRTAPFKETEIKRLRAQYGWFHPHLEFPAVFDKEDCGFDVVLGNPPWDVAEVDEEEFFSTRAPHIATAKSGRIRRQEIAELQNQDFQLWQSFQEEKRATAGFRHFVQHSGRFPKSSVGRINLYPLFVENSLLFIQKLARSGLIVPSAVSMDAYNAPL